MPRNLTIGLATIAFIASGYFLFDFGVPNFAINKDKSKQGDTAAVININPKPGEVVVSGVLECTPLKSGLAVGEGQCIMGLKGDDKKFYSLDTTKLEEAFGTQLKSGVMIAGTYVPADTSSSEAGGYLSD